MKVIADIRIITEDGRVIFDEKNRYLETESHLGVENNDVVNFEELELHLRWIERGEE